MENEQQVAQNADDLERLAQELVQVRNDLTARIDGVRMDADVALLQQVNNLVKRFERLEKLFAEAALRAVGSPEDLVTSRAA